MLVIEYVPAALLESWEGDTAAKEPSGLEVGIGAGIVADGVAGFVPPRPSLFNIKLFSSSYDWKFSIGATSGLFAGKAPEVIGVALGIAEGVGFWFSVCGAAPKL